MYGFDMNANRWRPVDTGKQQEQKAKLLAAAMTLLKEKSYNSITIRELGKTAGVNSALVGYYFDNKEGLFTALLDEMAKTHFSRMQNIMHAQEPIREFIHIMLSMLNENSGLARIMHDEVLSRDSSLKNLLIERFPKRMASFLPMLITQQIAAGRLSENINAKYAAFSLIGLIVMPFVGAPIREMAWQISEDELKQPEWAENIYRLFLTGYGKRGDNV